MYKIIEIMDRNGNVKTDSDSLRRKGSVVDMGYIVNGDRAIITYLADNSGKEKSGYIATSTVEDYFNTDDGMIIYTRNSVYCFKNLSE